MIYFRPSPLVHTFDGGQRSRLTRGKNNVWQTQSIIVNNWHLDDVLRINGIVDGILSVKQARKYHSLNNNCSNKMKIPLVKRQLQFDLNWAFAIAFDCEKSSELAIEFIHFEPLIKNHVRNIHIQQIKSMDPNSACNDARVTERYQLVMRTFKIIQYRWNWFRCHANSII